MIKKVNCPTCQSSVEWNNLSIYKPFCSERCRLIDLGEWVSESHAIAGEPAMPFEENDNYNISTDE